MRRATSRHSFVAEYHLQLWAELCPPKSNVEALAPMRLYLEIGPLKRWLRLTEVIRVGPPSNGVGLRRNQSCCAVAWAFWRWELCIMNFGCLSPAVGGILLRQLEPTNRTPEGETAMHHPEILDPWDGTSELSLLGRE